MFSMSKRKWLVFILILFLFLNWFKYPSLASAQSETGYNLVAAVNALRVSYDLEPYSIDPSIMDYQYQADTQTQVASPAPFLPIITSTPLAAGEIWHIVLEGETLWGIAVSYGVTMQAIQDLNGMTSEETTIYTGSKLLIKSASEPSMSTTLDSTTVDQIATSQQPTSTLSPTVTTTPSVSFTTSPSENESGLKNNMRTGEIVGLSVIGLGVLMIIIHLLRKSPRHR
jgi:hypothetical protein